MAEEKKAIEKKVREKKVRIARIDPDNVRPIFVNDFLVSHGETEFFLTFSVLEPVAIQNEEELDGLDSISAIARVKLVLTPKFAEAVMKALSTNIDGHKERFGKNDSREQSE